MSVFISIIILILATLIQLFLWLGPGVFSIFYHHSLGITSAKKADDRSLSLIVGVEISTILFFVIIYSIITIFILENNPINQTFFLVLSILLLISAILAFIIHIARPQIITKSLIYHAGHAKNRTDTIILGLIIPALELVITLPLYIICSVTIFYFSFRFSFVYIIIYTIAATVPLFIIRTYYRTGHTLADIIRFRRKTQLPARIILSASLLTIAILTFITGLSF